MVVCMLCVCMMCMCTCYKINHYSSIVLHNTLHNTFTSSSIEPAMILRINLNALYSLYLPSKACVTHTPHTEAIKTTKLLSITTILEKGRVTYSVNIIYVNVFI